MVKYAHWKATPIFIELMGLIEKDFSKQWLLSLFAHNISSIPISTEYPVHNSLVVFPEAITCASNRIHTKLAAMEDSRMKRV